jgi:hypothetical protein
LFTAFWREEKLRKYMYIQKRIQQKRTSSVLGGVLVWVPHVRNREETKEGGEKV